MNDETLSAFLDDALPPEQVGALLQALRGDSPQAAALRDRLTVMLLINDALAGIEAQDDGYTLRILARLREHPAWRAGPAQPTGRHRPAAGAGPDGRGRGGSGQD
jgi:hypothetical protein